ncbi:hypothetical protein ACGF13_38455 [Kitasatospora sp. NPDC048286]|uniref:hypothetical protein n=1 Tax=Kitasatospora sp. NPDC048286 TaxID=3364047 RepID=UPI00371C5734
MGRSAWDVATERVVWLDDGVEGLEGGLAGNRYVCQACGEPLILKALVPTSASSPSPHFAHQGSAPCSAPEREAQIDALTEVVIKFRDTICAVPGVTATLELPDTKTGAPTGLGPVIIACFSGTTVAIERPPGRLPGPDVLRRRIEAVHDRHPSAAHVWFLKKDRAQFGKVGTIEVWLDGKADSHDTVAPTGQQETIVAAGGHVYWLDGQLALLPYGVHYFRHPERPGQDWTGWQRWHSDPREDWRISQPQPAPDADCWGLVPVALSSLTRTRAVFQPSTAHRIMSDLYAAQGKRHGWRNRQAYAVYRTRHQQPLPPPPAVPTTTAPSADTPMPPAEPTPTAPTQPPNERTSPPQHGRLPRHPGEPRPLPGPASVPETVPEPAPGPPARPESHTDRLPAPSLSPEQSEQTGPLGPSTIGTGQPAAVPPQAAEGPYDQQPAGDSVYLLAPPAPATPPVRPPRIPPRPAYPPTIHLTGHQMPEAPPVSGHRS